MELYRLKSFLSIVRTGNLTRSAEQLHISQSALSSQLKQLEEELGFSLFDRTSRGMQLTSAGRELLPCVDGLFEAEEKLTQKAQALRYGGGESLHVGLNADPGFLRAGAINRRLQQMYRDINVIFLTSQTVRAAQLLRQGQLDLAFFYGTLSEPDIRFLKLADVRFCVVVPTPLLPQGEELGWAEVAALPWVWVEQGSPPYDELLREFSRYRLIPQQKVKTVDEYIVKELVLDGQGVAIMREDEARPMAAAGRVVIWQKGWLTLPLCLAWAVRDEDKPRVRTARDVVDYLWKTSRPEQAGENGFNY